MIELNGPMIRLLLTGGGLGVFLLIELIHSYRRPTVSKFSRWRINMSLTVFNSLILYLVFGAAIVATSSYVTINKLGVLNLFSLPLWARTLITLAFMDFMLYVWHLLNHEMPFLWRFHRVHHADLNMDVSTATRFHIGELMISAVIKIGLVYFIGADILGVLIFESALVLAAQFHHSSLKIPPLAEAFFWPLFVPPSMHRIHHSVVIKERNTNYGTVFSVWDRALGTLLKKVDQDRIKIGVGAYRHQQKLDFLNLLIMPVTKPIK
jgi:sterol desaturase/sphingolipid hydroxylase (fatty acid hydroxylase superfamily)